MPDFVSFLDGSMLLHRLTDRGALCEAKGRAGADVRMHNERIEDALDCAASVHATLCPLCFNQPTTEEASMPENVVYLSAPAPSALAPMADSLGIHAGASDRAISIAEGNPGALVALAGALKQAANAGERVTFFDRLDELGLRGSDLYSARKRAGDDTLFFIMVWGRDREGLGLEAVAVR